MSHASLWLSMTHPEPMAADSIRGSVLREYLLERLILYAKQTDLATIINGNTEMLQRHVQWGVRAVGLR